MIAICLNSTRLGSYNFVLHNRTIRGKLGSLYVFYHKSDLKYSIFVFCLHINFRRLALNNQIIIWVHFQEWIPMGVTLVTIPLLLGENAYLRLITETPLTTYGLPYMINPSSGTWSLLRYTTYLLLYFSNIYLICLLIMCISDACC